MLDFMPSQVRYLPAEMDVEAVAVCCCQEQHIGAQRRGKLCCGCGGSGQAFFPIAATPADPAAPSGGEPALRAGGGTPSAPAVRPNVTGLCLHGQEQKAQIRMLLARD